MDIKYYEANNGKSPFLNWQKKLGRVARAKIRTYLNRLRLGNFGSCKSLRGNLYEIRIHYGPGYRVYFGKKDSELVLVLAGGDKESQTRDIERAREYWKDYLATKKKEEG